MSRTTVHTPFKHAVLTAPDREITHHGCQHDPEGDLRIIGHSLETEVTEPGWVTETRYVHHNDTLPARARKLGAHHNRLFVCADKPELCHNHPSRQALRRMSHIVYQIEVWDNGGAQTIRKPIYGVAECDAGQQNPGGCWVFAPSALKHFGREQSTEDNLIDVARDRENTANRKALRRAAQEYNTYGEIIDHIDEPARHL